MPQKITNKGLEKYGGSEVVIFDSDGLSIMGLLDINRNTGLDDRNRFKVLEGEYGEDFGVQLYGDLHEEHDLNPGERIRIIVNPKLNRDQYFRTYIYSQ